MESTDTKSKRDEFNEPARESGQIASVEFEKTPNGRWRFRASGVVSVAGVLLIVALVVMLTQLTLGDGSGSFP